MPETSVRVVTNTADDVAGSIRTARRTRGTSTPPRAASLVVLVQQQVADGPAGRHSAQNGSRLFPIEPAQDIGRDVWRTQVEYGRRSFGANVPDHLGRVRGRHVGERLGGNLVVRRGQQCPAHIGFEVFEYGRAVRRSQAGQLLHRCLDAAFLYVSPDTFLDAGQLLGAGNLVFDVLAGRGQRLTPARDLCVTSSIWR